MSFEELGCRWLVDYWLEKMQASAEAAQVEFGG